MPRRIGFKGYFHHLPMKALHIHPDTNNSTHHDIVIKYLRVLHENKLTTWSARLDGNANLRPHSSPVESISIQVSFEPALPFRIRIFDGSHPLEPVAFLFLLIPEGCENISTSLSGQILRSRIDDSKSYTTSKKRAELTQLGELTEHDSTPSSLGLISGPAKRQALYGIERKR